MVDVAAVAPVSMVVSGSANRFKSSN